MYYHTYTMLQINKKLCRCRGTAWCATNTKYCTQNSLGNDRGM